MKPLSKQDYYDVILALERRIEELVKPSSWETPGTLLCKRKAVARNRALLARFKRAVERDEQRDK